MQKKNLLIVFVFFLVVTFVLYSQASATRSRLSGMGDLSIVIEDESNMINLWDFAKNPAGFLDDEKGSVVRGDFLWDTYQIRNLSRYDEYGRLSIYKADGYLLDSWLSSSLREERGFALGVEGNYFFRQTNSKYQKNEYTSPKILLVFTKHLDPLTSFGSSLRYLEDKWELRYKTYPDNYEKKVKDFQAEIGVSRKLTSDVILGATLGYDSFKRNNDPEEKISSYYVSDSYALWLSGQTIVEIERKLKLILETTFRFKRADFQRLYYEYVDVRNNKRENYYYSYLKFRGVYNFTPMFRIGLFFFDNELYHEFEEPVFSYYSFTPYEFTVRHWGAGCSYKLDQSMMVGAEYHFRDSSQPSEDNNIWGWKDESFNLGIEGKIKEAWSLRGGFIRTETNENPNYIKKRYTWENTLTSGFGYEPERLNLLLEFSYQYAFKKFKQFWGYPDLKSASHIFALSFKKGF